MSLIVQKFGGTSVGDPERIRNVARIITNTFDKGHQVLAVVSAMGHTTDELVDLAKQITDSPSGREYDALLATGEMISTSLVAMTLNSMGYKAVGLNGWQAGVHTEDVYNKAHVLHIDTNRVQQYLNDGYIVILTGFQGIDSKQDITTLGRGGSDTSAVAMAAALKAERCDIYTDVRGIYSTDPRVVPEAVKLDRIAYIEMMELARAGASVLHPRAVEIAKQWNVTLSKRSTFDLEDPGTMVVGVEAIEMDRSVTGIACDENQARVGLVGVPDKPGVAGAIFGALAKHHVSVDMIVQSVSPDNQTIEMAFTVSQDDLKKALSVLEEVKAKLGGTHIILDEDVSKISIVGAGMIDRPGIAADCFKALADANINIKMISTSEIKISCLVEKSASKEAVRVIHRRFFPQVDSPEAVMVNTKLGY